MENHKFTKIDRNRGKRMEIQNNHKGKGKMVYIPIITLNMNGLPIKMQSGWMDLKKKLDLDLYCLQETHFSSKDTHGLE